MRPPWCHVASGDGRGACMHVWAPVSRTRGASGAACLPPHGRCKRWAVPSRCRARRRLAAGLGKRGARAGSYQLPEARSSVEDTSARNSVAGISSNRPCAAAEAGARRGKHGQSAKAATSAIHNCGRGWRQPHGLWLTGQPFAHPARQHGRYFHICKRLEHSSIIHPARHQEGAALVPQLGKLQSAQGHQVAHSSRSDTSSRTAAGQCVQGLQARREQPWRRNLAKLQLVRGEVRKLRCVPACQPAFALCTPNRPGRVQAQAQLPTHGRPPAAAWPGPIHSTLASPGAPLCRTCRQGQKLMEQGWRHGGSEPPDRRGTAAGREAGGDHGGGGG